MDALVEIMTRPRNAMVKQYQRLFKMEKAELEFTDAALRSIAAKAKEHDTGARGLRRIVENLMLDIMFELTDQKPGTKYVVTEAVVSGDEVLFPMAAKKGIA